MAGQSDGWTTTARLLRRTGFGVTGAQVDAVAKQNWPDYVDAALRADPGKDPGAMATPMPTLPDLRGPGKGAGVAERKEFNRHLSGQMTELSEWWLRRMVAVEQPIHEKLTLLWHNHFATSGSKVRLAAQFGRRVKANGAGGTDHGTAGPMFVAGGPVRGGFYGDEPSLTDLDNGDLKPTTDFRDVYYELLSKTLRTDPTPSVGTGRPSMGFLA